MPVLPFLGNPGVQQLWAVKLPACLLPSNVAVHCMSGPETCKGNSLRLSSYRSLTQRTAPQGPSQQQQTFPVPKICPGSQAPDGAYLPTSALLPQTMLPQTRVWKALGRGGFGSVFRVATEHVRGFAHPAVALKAAALTSHDATLAVYNELALMTQCAGHVSIPAVRLAWHLLT